ncbi:MAG: polysaccharide deacetylase family protein [Thermonemataceae bacterium]|nr:polysaccharide deacetylase family protein [Thermonemataceae bacterium]
MPHFFKTPHFISKIFPSIYWKIPTQEPTIFLTFDDGPIPQLTPWVLDILAQYKAKATFFCVGENIEKYPEVFMRIISEKHQVGNHTYHHLNSWKTASKNYISDVLACQHIIEKYHLYSYLFRPPYGKLTWQVKKILENTHKQKIVLWDMLSYDFDASVSPENSLRQLRKHSQKGSIIVFHDNLKAQKNLAYILPSFLEYFSTKGFRFEVLPTQHFA